LKFGRLILFSVLALFGGVRAADVPNNTTLSGNTAFPNGTWPGSGGTYTVGDNITASFHLNAFTATFNNGTAVEIWNKAADANGKITIDLSNPNLTVTYKANNSYTGLTTVKNGVLFFDETTGSAVPGNLTIGGGTSAIVRRRSDANVERISNTATVTLLANGTLELNRRASGTTAANNSSETVGTLIMNGGTLLNASANSSTTAKTLFVASTFTLSDNSTIDLGPVLSLNFTAGTGWTAGKTLTFLNYDANDSIVFGNTLSASQLSEIRFPRPGGDFVGAWQSTADKMIRPTPEVSTVWAFPILGVMVAFTEVRKRQRKKVAAQ
jgi:hypothetical protein